jgi:hypothetical protein
MITGGFVEAEVAGGLTLCTSVVEILSMLMSTRMQSDEKTERTQHQFFPAP